MSQRSFALDPRYFQVIFQVIFFSYGIFFLDWNADWLHYIIIITGCLCFNFYAESFRQKHFLPVRASLGFTRWGFSVLISALSLCLLLKTNHWYTSLLAAFLTVASKYIFRFNHKHIFNPSAFGIIATIFLTHDAWLSPGQWGGNAVIFYVLGWPMDYFIHSVSTGSLLLFTFFMISDPKTSPNHTIARIIWAILIAAVSFYLAAFKWKYNTPIWVLVAAAPLAPLLDKIFKAEIFQWEPSGVRFSFLSKIKNIVMKPFFKKLAAFIILAAMKKSDIKVVDQKIFTTLNEYSKPRLVEYYDQNPCEQYKLDEVMTSKSLQGKAYGLTVRGNKSLNEETVKIEAKYIVGEYDILILSATESAGLKSWLDENGYKIPAGAEEVLEPYIKSNLKFFVVKVNEEEKKKLPGNFLRPIQISFNSPKFMLPIRLGMANADGDQDLIVYAFTKKGRIECTNYRTVSLPTGKNIPLFVQNNFGNFYSNLFQHQWDLEGKSVTMLEYAWDVSPKNYVKCDPCVATAPSTQDLVQAGVWWINRDWSDYNDVQNDEEYSQNVYFTRLHVRYNRKAFPQDLMFQLTPNTDNFQARYIITHPATGDFNCEAGKKYLNDLRQRRQDELKMLTYLTGKGYSDWDVVMNDKEEKNIPTEISYKNLRSTAKPPEKDKGFFLATLGVMSLITVIGLKQKKKKV